MSDSSSFDLLDAAIQRWVWAEGWTELRDAQEKSIPLIMDATNDVIIAAATAAGKTEAAFLPILSKMLKNPSGLGLTIYISPLKALINDQFGRLELLCASLDIPVWPWHGDVSASLKSRFLKKPEGVLLITPESLEAMLCNRGFIAPQLFKGLEYFVVDELHAFIGSERGKQMQSLMHRIDIACNQKSPRVGLSATLGDMRMAADYLRPGAGDKVSIIESKSDSGALKLLVKGYIEPLPIPTVTKSAEDVEEDNDLDNASIPQVTRLIAEHLFKNLRGSNNLIFPNSRRMVEQYSFALRSLCDEARVPNEFWPHHGSLSREIREETEAALKNKERPANAVCTNTLELGIDIGSVKSIVQIGSPPSVASLRQRLGRSGRRKGESAILRGYVVERELSERSHVADTLREGLFELVACIELLLENWYEPPRSQGMHLSTLVQQILSLIAQHGGVTANTIYKQLCQSGPFNTISQTDFIALLRHLGQIEVIQQDSSGLLLHGKVGESFVNHYTFYAAFSTEEEYRVVSNGRTLGSIPISSLVSAGDFIMFAAKTWLVTSVEDKTKTIIVSRHKTGKVPPFKSGFGHVHSKVRAKMRELYESDKPIAYIDTQAKDLMEEGRKAYRNLGLDQTCMMSSGNNTVLFTWSGDAVNLAIIAILKYHGIRSVNLGLAIEVYGNSNLLPVIKRISSQNVLTPTELLQENDGLLKEKWDWALPETLLMKSYASHNLDIEQACNLLASL